VTGKIKRRLVAVLAGALIFLLVLEISLRIVGSIYANLSESDKGNIGDAAKTILCIGDSVTFGIGAPGDLSYPAQLQKLLNESNPESKYSVINRGWPAQNTAQILMRLKKWLQEFKPDIVTILIGAQNQANYYGYGEYLQKERNQKRGFFLSIHDRLDRIRIYKFLRLLFRDGVEKSQFSFYPHAQLDGSTSESEGNHDKQKKSPDYSPNFKSMSQGPGDSMQMDQFRFYSPSEQDPTALESVRNQDKNITPECAAGFKYMSQGYYDKALESILAVIEKKEVESDCYHTVGSIYNDQKLYDKAIFWFKKGIERDPGQFINYEGIGLVYRGQNQLHKTLFWLKKGFAHARYDTLYERCYLNISTAFGDLGDFRGAIEFFQKETQRQPLVDDYLHTLANDYMLMFKNNRIKMEVHQWVEAEIEQIVELCRQFNARVVLQNYPFEPRINYIFKRVAKRRNVPFIDHQTSFKQFIHDGVFNPDYFVPDGHPNARGYHIMAKNIWMVLKDKIK